MIKSSVLETVGNTPVVKINRLGPKRVNLYVKMESFNPLGSVKDRLALGVIEAAEQDGSLRPGQTVIEASSGNTGIGLAMVCAQKGHPLVIVMAENFSEERRKLLRFLGAKVVLTPAWAKGTGMKAKAKELAEQNGWFLCRQFENEANKMVHYRTTAKEIADDFADIGLDYWVSGYGTGGTLSGVATGLKEWSPGTKIMVAEPDNIQILKGGVAQPENPMASHPHARPHPIQGWTPDFIPKLLDPAVMDLVDGFIPVNGTDAMTQAKALAQQEGVFVGISAGATFAAALQLAETAPEGSHILCMLPDTGERYLSTALFADVAVKMTAEEQAIAQSTPTARFGDAPPTPAVQFPSASELDPKVLRWVEAQIAAHKVMIFSLEWCDFCIALKRLLADLGVAYECIDVDAAEHRDQGFGAEVKRVLMHKTQSINLPQVYLGGTAVGGFAEVAELVQGQDPRLVDHSKPLVQVMDYAPSWLNQAV